MRVPVVAAKLGQGDAVALTQRDGFDGTRIEALRRIVESGLSEGIDGWVIDVVNARLLLSVYDGLGSPAYREEFRTEPLPWVISMAWKAAHAQV